MPKHIPHLNVEERSQPCAAEHRQIPAGAAQIGGAPYIGAGVPKRAYSVDSSQCCYGSKVLDDPVPPLDSFFLFLERPRPKHPAIPYCMFFGSGNWSSIWWRDELSRVGIEPAWT